MFRKTAHCNVILSAVLCLSFLAAGKVSAGPIINFIELPGNAGVQLTGFDAFGGPLDVTKLGSETFHISSPAVPGGYSPDAILSHIGISGTSNGYLINILNSPGGSLVGQVWVHQFVPQFSVIDFTADPTKFVGGAPFANVVATGGLQNVLDYLNDRGEVVTINVSLNVPEPATLTLLGISVAGLAGCGWMRRKQAATV